MKHEDTERRLGLDGALFPLLLIVVFLASVRVIRNGDLGFHLSGGRWIAEHGAVPSMDMLSFIASGSPWINFQWLYELVSWVNFSLNGMTGVILLHALVNVAVFTLLYLYLRKQGVGAVPVMALMVLVLLAVEPRLTIRPHAFERLFVVLFLSRFLVLRRGEGPWWPLVVLQVFWCNVHGSYLLALLVCLVWLVERLVVRGDWKKPLLLLPLLAVAGCLTPYGPTQSIHLLKHRLAVKGMASNPEWMPLRLSSDVLFDPAFLSFLILAVTACWLLWKGSRDQGLFLWVLLAFSVAGPFIHARLLSLSAIQLAFISAEALRGRPQPAWLVGGNARIAALAVLLLLAFVFPANAYYKLTGRTTRFGLGISAETAGWGAGAYLAQLKVERVFNTYQAGGWIGWWILPHGGQVFLDSRDVGNVFSAADLVEYRTCLENPDYLLTRAEEGNWDAIALDLEDPLCSMALERLASHPAWRIGYMDPAQAVFIQEGSPLQPVSAPPLGVYWSETVYGESWKGLAGEAWGRSLMRLKLDASAAAAYEQALEEKPYSLEALSCLGLFALGGDQPEKAVEFLQKAVLIDERHASSQQNLAIAFMKLGQPDRAVFHGEQSVKLRPEDPIAWLNLAQYYTALGQGAEADRCNRIARMVENRGRR